MSQNVERALRERRGSNPRLRARQARALPLSYSPKPRIKLSRANIFWAKKGTRTLSSQDHNLILYQLSYIRRLSPRRIERRTLRLSSVRSNQLSYGLATSPQTNN